MQVYDERDEYGHAVEFFQRCNVKGHAKVARRFVWSLIAAAILSVVIVGWPA